MKHPTNWIGICSIIWAILIQSLGALVFVVSVVFSPIALPQSSVEQVCEDLNRDPRLDPIRGKVQLSLHEPLTVLMMANNLTPGVGERSAILAWAEQRQKCQDFAAQQYGPSPPHVSAMHRANSQLMADLYSGRLTFGDFVRRVDNNYAAFLQQDATISQESADRDRAQWAAMDQAARERTDARNQIMNNYQQRQNEIRQQYREEALLRDPGTTPTATNVRCTSNQIGDQIYTDCN